MNPLKQIRKIAVLRANGIGDFVFALPALQALRAAYPDAEIVYLGKKMHQALLMKRSAPVDRVVVVPPCAGVGEPEDFPTDRAKVEKFLRSMREERFDVAIQIHGGGGFSNAFLLRLGAAFTVGLQAPGAPALDVSIPYRVFFSETLRYLEVVSWLGARPLDPYPRLAVIPHDLDEARKAFPDFERRRYAFIHAGATDLRRHWPSERFAEVGDWLCERGLTVCVGGSGEEEGRIARDIIDAMRHGERVVDLSNRLSLNGLVGVLARARLMLSNDSGPLHLAEALETPSVGVYLVCNMINAMPMRLRHSRPLISWITACPLCGTPLDRLQETEDTCRHDASFAAGVSVAEAREAIESLESHVVIRSDSPRASHPSRSQGSRST